MANYWHHDMAIMITADYHDMFCGQKTEYFVLTCEHLAGDRLQHHCICRWPGSNGLSVDCESFIRHCGCQSGYMVHIVTDMLGPYCFQ